MNTVLLAEYNSLTPGKKATAGLCTFTAVSLQVRPSVQPASHPGVTPGTGPLEAPSLTGQCVLQIQPRYILANVTATVIPSPQNQSVDLRSSCYMGLLGRISKTVGLIRAALRHPCLAKDGSPTSNISVLLTSLCVPRHTATRPSLLLCLGPSPTAHPLTLVPPVPWPPSPPRPSLAKPLVHVHGPSRSARLRSRSQCRSNSRGARQAGPLPGPS